MYDFTIILWRKILNQYHIFSIVDVGRVVCLKIKWTLYGVSQVSGVLAAASSSMACPEVPMLTSTHL